MMVRTLPVSHGVAGREAESHVRVTEVRWGCLVLHCARECLGAAHVGSEVSAVCAGVSPWPSVARCGVNASGGP